MMVKTLSCSGLRYPACFRSLPNGMWMVTFRELRILSKVAIRLKDGTTALSAAEKIERGKTAIGALAPYRAAKSAGHEEDAAVAYKVLQENMPYFGYGYIKDVNQLVPNVPLNFYAFRVMVILGGYFILFFIVVLFFVYKKDLSKMRWMHWIAFADYSFGLHRRTGRLGGCRMRSPALGYP